MLIEIKNIFILTFIFGGALILYGSYNGLYLIANSKNKCNFFEVSSKRGLIDNLLILFD
jgi:hypothetical protein